MKGDFLVLSPHFTQRGSAWYFQVQTDLRSSNPKSPHGSESFQLSLLFNLEEQRPKGIVNIPPMTDKIYFDNCFTVV